MTTNTKTCIFVPLLLSESMGSGDKTFDFDGGIDLSYYGIVMVECCEELWLRLVSQDLSPAGGIRNSEILICFIVLERDPSPERLVSPESPRDTLCIEKNKNTF